MTTTIVVATTEGGLDDRVSPVFGRAPTFTVVEVEGNEIRGSEVVANPFKDSGSGAGIQAAQLVAHRAPRAALAGNFGPNVSGVFSAAGIELVPVSEMTVREAVVAYTSGKVTPSPGTASVSSSSGMGAGPGRGMGRGAGMGRGMGQGMGRRSGGMNAGAWAPSGTGALDPNTDPQALKQRIADLETQLAQVRRKLSETQGGDRDA